MREYNIALVGLGKMGRVWFDVISKNPLINRVAFVEQNATLLQSFASEFNINQSNLYSTVFKAVNSRKLDFIIDITPPSVKDKTALVALQNDVHVLSEKPLAEDITMAKKLQQISREKCLNYMVSQDYRYNPVPIAIQTYLKQGLIGKLGFIEISFHRNTTFNKGNFRFNLEYPMLLDMSVHHLDLLRFFVGSDVRNIQTFSFKNPWSTFKGDESHVMFIDLDNIKVSYTASWSSKGIQTSRAGNWRFDGDKGSILWNGDTLTLLKEKNKKQVEEELQYNDLPLISQDFILNEFIESIKSGREPLCSIDDNIKTLKLCFDAIDSAKENGVDLVDSK
jgi:predicted dehydrogenase